MSQFSDPSQAIPGEESLIEQHTPLVRFLVKKLCEAGYLRHADRPEAVQIGQIQLLAAIRRHPPDAWQPSQGKWSALAAVIIRRAITKHFGRQRMQDRMFVLSCDHEYSYSRRREDVEDRREPEVELFESRLSQLREAIGKLDPLEAELLCLRFGIFGYRPHTNSQLSARLKRPKQEIARIEREAVAKLKALATVPDH